MFMGEFQHNIDEKGRIIVPAKFREGLGSNFVLTRGLDQCLFIYPEDEWKILEEKLKSLPLRSEEHTSELQSRFDIVCRLLLEKSVHPLALHSFPTRRSSDLHVYGRVST